MRIPFFVMRFAMAIAVLSVIGLVAWLLLQEDKRDGIDQSDADGASPQTTTPVQSTEPNSENVNELLIQLNQLTAPPRTAPYIAQATRFQDRLRVQEELIRNLDELDEPTATMIKRGLMGTLYQLHSINRFEQVADKNIFDKLKSQVNQLANDEDQELRRTANVTRTAMSILDVFDFDPQENELEKAKTAIDQLLNDFPSKKNSYATLYLLISDYGAEQNAQSSTLALLKHVNEHCLKSDIEDIHRLGETYVGRVLLIENDVLNLRGRLDLKTGSDEQKLVENLQNFFATGYPLSGKIADAVGEIANALEKLQKNQSALTVYRMLAERIGSDQQLEAAAKLTANGLKRLESVGQQVDFPDLAKGQHNLIAFVSNTPKSQQSIRQLANLRILNARTKLNLVLVSIDDDTEPIRQFLDDNRLSDLTVVSDPEKKSPYFKAYPAEFFPTLIIVDPDGAILDVNMNQKRTKELLDEISETS